MKFKFLFFFLILIRISPTLGLAQEEDYHLRKWEIGLHPGISLPSGDTNDLQLPSFYLGSSLEYNKSRRTSFGLEMGVSTGHELSGTLNFDYENDGIKETLDIVGDTNLTVFHFTPFIKRGSIMDWGTRGERWVRRYLLLGMGWYHTSNDAGAWELTGITSGGTNLTGQLLPIKKDSRDFFGINIGFGLGTEIWTNYRIGFDLRYHHLAKGHGDNPEYVIPSFRFSRLF